MAYKAPTLQELIEDLEKAYATHIDDTRKMPVSVQKANARVLGYALNALYEYLEHMGRQIVPTTADGDYLRRHCSQIGLYAKQKSKASGTVLIEGTIDSALSVGEFLRRGDGFQYVVAESVIVSSATQSIKVIADQAGVDGNCAAGTVLTFVNAIAGISPTATVELIGAGADDETDKELLSRYVEYMRNLYMGGADSDYKKWALEVEGITRAWVYPHAMGAGTVVVRGMTPNGFPDEILLQKTKDHIDSKRPVTVKRIYVLAPSSKLINLEIANLQPNTQEMRDAITASLQSSFNTNSEPGGVVLVSKINSAILSTLNLIDYKLVTPTDNIQCADGELAVLGEITWS